MYWIKTIPPEWETSYHEMTKRNYEKFKVKKTKTGRYFNSAVISMQRMLNEVEKENVKVF